MSEVKGTLLTIVLAVSVFGIVFGIITAAIKKNADTVSERMDEAVLSEVKPTTDSQLYSLHY